MFAKLVLFALSVAFGIHARVPMHRIPPGEVPVETSPAPFPTPKEKP